MSFTYNRSYRYNQLNEEQHKTLYNITESDDVKGKMEWDHDVMK